MKITIYGSMHSPLYSVSKLLCERFGLNFFRDFSSDMSDDFLLCNMLGFLDVPDAVNIYLNTSITVDTNSTSSYVLKYWQQTNVPYFNGRTYNLYDAKYYNLFIDTTGMSAEDVTNTIAELIECGIQGYIVPIQRLLPYNIDILQDFVSNEACFLDVWNPLPVKECYSSLFVDKNARFLQKLISMNRMFVRITAEKINNFEVLHTNTYQAWEERTGLSLIGTLDTMLLSHYCVTYECKNEVEAFDSLWDKCDPIKYLRNMYVSS